MSSSFQESKQYPGEHLRVHEFRDVFHAMDDVLDLVAVGNAIGRRVIGIGGKDLEQGPANNVFAPRFCRFQTRLVGLNDRQVGHKHPIGRGRRLENPADILWRR
jgi:hypothetical protein